MQIKCTKCKNSFEVSADSEQVYCPECGQAISISSLQSVAEYTDSEATVNLYNERYKLVKKLSKSWLMLVLAITVTITTVFAIIDLIPHLRGLLMIANIVKIILYAVLCIGVWQIFLRGRTDSRNISGFKCVNGYITTLMAVVVMIVSLILIVVFMTFGIASEIAGDIPLGDGITLNTVLIIAIFVLIAVVVVISMFFKSIQGVLKSAQSIMLNKPITHSSFIMAAVILFIIGLVKFISIFLMGAMTEMLNALFGALAENLPGIGGLVSGITVTSSWSSILLDVCGMLNYILGGIIIIIYSIKLKPIAFSSVQCQM